MGSLIDRFASASSEAPFPAKDFPALAAEVREAMLETVGRNGGHLASSLGVVELTIALLATFDARRDRIVWDVGHQGYAWKLLTGRAAEFPTLRKKGGISGFLKRRESPCDAFDAGHAGTAVSAALGMAVARDRLGGNENVVAVVGDASFANGLTLEALNNVAASTSRLVIVLNDNEMSISENVGALSRYFGRMLASARYNRAKRAIESGAKRIRLDPLRDAYYRTEQALKGLFVRNGFVESLGIRYVGPIDGHDFGALMDALAIARDSDRPILIHVATTKGKGYAPAEKEPEKWHGVGPFDVATGALPPSSPSFSSVFGEALADLAARDSRVAAITAAMRTGTGLDGFARRFPERFFDVGISEEHAVTFAAGLASSGLRPFAAIYSTFAQRAVDNVFHDVCLQNLPVCLCLDRAGVVGADGPTHHGLYDITLLRPFPRITIMQPRDGAMLARMLDLATRINGPSVIRYPRGAAEPPADGAGLPPLETGKAEVVRDVPGAKVWIWALGDMLPAATAAADILSGKGVPCGVVDPVFVKPLDLDLLLAQAASGALVASVENGCRVGGFGSAVLEALASNGLPPSASFGFPDAPVGQGTQSELFAAYGLDADSIADAVFRLQSQRVSR